MPRDVRILSARPGALMLASIVPAWPCSALIKSPSPCPATTGPLLFPAPLLFLRTAAQRALGCYRPCPTSSSFSMPRPSLKRNKGTKGQRVWRPRPEPCAKVGAEALSAELNLCKRHTEIPPRLSEQSRREVNDDNVSPLRHEPCRPRPSRGPATTEATAGTTEMQAPSSPFSYMNPDNDFAIQVHQ